MTDINSEKKPCASIQIMKFILQDDVESVKKVLSIDKNQLNFYHKSSGDSPLIVAARYRRFNILKELVNMGAGLDHANIDGKHAIHEAAYSGCVLSLKYLIQKGAQVDALKRADWTPLMIACTQGHLEIVKCLVENGADIHRTNKDGWTCFHVACREGCLDVVEYLCNIDMNVSKTISYNKRTVLHTCAMHGKLNVATFLIERNLVSYAETDSCGNTPLMDAFRFGHIDLARLLLRNSGVHLLDVKDSLGRHCLHVSAQSGQLSSVKYLLENCKIDIDLLTNILNQNIIHLLAKEGHSQLMEYILQRNANINAVDVNERTALHFAVGANKVDTARILLKYNCDQTIKDIFNKLPIQYALSDEMKNIFS